MDLLAFGSNVIDRPFLLLCGISSSMSDPGKHKHFAYIEIKHIG